MESISITKSGHHLSHIKTNVIELGEGLYVECYDNIYVVDRSSTSEVYLYGKKGKPMKMINRFNGVGDVAIVADGSLWINLQNFPFFVVLL